MCTFSTLQYPRNARVMFFEDETAVVWPPGGWYLQVPPEESAEFHDFLKALGYTYHDESRNPVYRQFFKSGR